MIDIFEFNNLGESSLLVTTHKSEDRKELNNVYKILESSKIDGLEDIIKTHSSIGLIFNAYQTTYNRICNKVKESINNKASSIEKTNPTIWRIPICYDKEYGIDLEQISNKLKISIENIINLHQKNKYKVDMIGFLPGFIYMSDNNDKLYIPRKTTPRKTILEGSIGIARNQTGIYNLKSPGGWNIVGRTPKKLFDKEINPPVAIREGDIIKFYEINKKKFKEIKELYK